jgi:hypothetical protein
VDQRGKASRKDDSPLLPSFPLEPSATSAESAGLQPGEFVAAAGVTKANRELVSHEHARYYWLLLAESHLTKRLFGNMLRRIAGLSLPAG